MSSKTWGTPQVIKEYIIVNQNDEIPSGNNAYVFNKSTSPYGDFVPKANWEALVNGDLSTLKNKIESDIPNTQVIWIKVSWDKAVGPAVPPGGVTSYLVSGFYVEAIVKNKGGAALTGLEIVMIIGAVAFLAAVVAAIALGAWIIWQVMSLIPDVLKPVVGIGLLIGIALFLLILFGARLGVSKKGMTLGR